MRRNPIFPHSYFVPFPDSPFLLHLAPAIALLPGSSVLSPPTYATLDTFALYLLAVTPLLEFCR
jgi:hypothetical protein